MRSERNLIEKSCKKEPWMMTDSFINGRMTEEEKKKTISFSKIVHTFFLMKGRMIYFATIEKKL
jgi:hypothetical protein